MRFKIKELTSQLKELVFLYEELSIITISPPIILSCGEMIFNSLSFQLKDNKGDIDIVSFDGYMFVRVPIETKLFFDDDCASGILFIDGVHFEYGDPDFENDDFSVFYTPKLDPKTYNDIPAYYVNNIELPIYMDRDKGIICIGDKDAKVAERAEIFKNCIVSLGERGQIVSVYIKLVRMSNKEYEERLTEIV